MSEVLMDQRLSTGIRGFVYEIFSGIQGESLLVGERQIFVRFAGCESSCVYCDTPGARERTDVCMVEQSPGKGDFITAQNPMTCGEALDHVQRLEIHDGLHHSVALTGGEPLAQSRFVGHLASELKSRGFRIFLETNGELPDRLTDVLPHVDIVSMDIKLASSAGGLDVLALHELFLKSASEKEVHAKIVVAANTSADELMDAARMVRSVDSTIPVVLQPVTPSRKISAPDPLRMLELQALCKELLPHVRVIPQCHKIMNQR